MSSPIPKSIPGGVLVPRDGKFRHIPADKIIEVWELPDQDSATAFLEYKTMDKSLNACVEVEALLIHQVIPGKEALFEAAKVRYANRLRDLKRGISFHDGEVEDIRDCMDPEKTDLYIYSMFTYRYFIAVFPID